MSHFRFMTGAAFSEALSHLDMPVAEAATFLGQPVKRIHDWLNDDRDIPRWVPGYLSALTVPRARQIAHETNQSLLEQEHNHVD